MYIRSGYHLPPFWDTGCILFRHPLSPVWGSGASHFFKNFIQRLLPAAVLWVTQLYSFPEIQRITTAEDIAYGLFHAFAYLLILPPVIVNAQCSARIKVKCKSDYTYAPACLPSLMQAFRFDIPGLHIINLAEMVPCVLRYPENINHRLMITILVSCLCQFPIIKFLVFFIPKNHVCVVGACTCALTAVLLIPEPPF